MGKNATPDFRKWEITKGQNYLQWKIKGLYSTTGRWPYGLTLIFMHGFYWGFYKFSSLWHSSPYDDIYIWFILVQVMAYWLTAPSHHLNIYWLIISDVAWHSPEGNFTGKALYILPWCEFLKLQIQNYIRIFWRGQWVKKPQKPYREIGFYDVQISLQFDRQLDSTAAEVPVKIQSCWKNINMNLAASKLYEILR